MNSCILMAKIIRSPELRYTQDNQTPIAQMLVEFDGSKPDDPPATLKVVGWGNMASEIQEQYQEGDRVVIVGRLSMNTVDRPEGFKEKRAELTVSQIHSVSSDGSEAVSFRSSNVANDDLDPVESSAKAKPASAKSQPKTAVAPEPQADDIPNQNLDDIPF